MNERAFAIGATFAAAVALGAAPRVASDTFQRVSYDPATDELVIVVAYQGTSADHQFSIKWGPCQADGGGQRIDGELLDQQFRDAARQSFKTTVRISLSALDCRPAKVTLRTAPRFYYTLQIPAPSAPPR